MKILFVTWDGPQVSYLEGLFLPVFARLQEFGFEFHVLQFTWANAARVDLTRKACKLAGVHYRSARVWRRPIGFGSLVTAFFGSWLVSKLARDWSIDVLMPRSNLPSIACLLALRRISLPVVFDADGLPLDERVDFAGDSPHRLTYRFLRDIESEMARRADRVLTRSQHAVEILLARAGAGTLEEKFHVVGNGRDEDKFSPGGTSLRHAMRHKLGVDTEAPLLVYAGSLGEQYCLNEMLEFFAAVKRLRSDARLLILSGSPEIACEMLTTKPLLEPATIVKAVSADDVPCYLACADLGLALRRSSFSMRAVAPIKVGEYLLCGLPVVATIGIGDTSAIGSAGFLLARMDVEELEAAAEWFCQQVLYHRNEFANLARAAGIKSFSLEACVAGYQMAFAELTSNSNR